MDSLSKIGIGPFASLNAEPTVKWEERGDFLKNKGEGIQHMSYFVKDIDPEVERMADLGYKVVQRGWRPTSGGYAFILIRKSPADLCWK